MVVHCANPFKFSCTGTLTLENTEKDKFMGIALLLNANDTRQVDEVITQEGMLPEYVRKYPRIPYIHRVGMMPFNVLTEFLIGKERNTCVFHLDNISPSGFQVYTEDPRVACLQPGHSVFVSFMPRGDGFIPVQLPATIRRMIQSKDPVSENMRYYFGMSMGTVTVEQRLNYSALLRRIVEELKA